MSDSTITKPIRGIGLRQDGDTSLIVSISGAESAALAAHLAAQAVAGRYYRHVSASLAKLGEDSWEVIFGLLPKTSLEAFEKFILNEASLWYGIHHMPLN